MNEFEVDNADNWEKYADLYNQNIGEEGDDFHQELIDPVILDVCGDLKEKRLVDAGCGNGYLSAKMIKLGARQVIGIDRSKQLIDIARKKNDIPGLQFELFDLNFGFPDDPEQVDIIVSNMVLQYLVDLETFASSAFQHLRRNGKVVLSVDHPFHMAIMRTLRLNGIPTSKFIDDAPYFSRSYCKKNSLWDKAILGYYHRPVEQYITPFLQVGFCVTSFYELGRNVNIGKTSEILPRVLVLGFSK